MLEADVVVVGGGINGAGIAADAAGRGLKVILCEKDDLAAATSAASSKLIHGGLRYLEQYDFKLVHSALKEREVLLNKAPHLISPLQFILPCDPLYRSKWLIHCGLFIYDHLARRSILPSTKKINLRTAIEGLPLKPHLKMGFSYYDCKVDDARLVIANAQAAKAKGATVLTRTEVVAAKRQHSRWQLTCFNHLTKKEMLISAKAIVNASGPWVQKVQKILDPQHDLPPIQLVKGSHLIVPKLYDGEHSYLLQHDDGRVIFVIPYQQQFSLIGTTDVVYTGEIAHLSISEAEIIYLQKVINHYFHRSFVPEEIVWQYAGVRTLWGDETAAPAKMSREFHVMVNDENGQLPLVTVLGGKITTYRLLAEQVLNPLKKYLPAMGSSWTLNAPLPGGEFNQGSWTQFSQQMQEDYLWLPPWIMQRYLTSYGSLTPQLLADANSLEDLGTAYGAGLYEREVQYLKHEEWAQTAEDILWRRTKLGLFLTLDQKEKLTI